MTPKKYIKYVGAAAGIGCAMFGAKVGLSTVNLWREGFRPLIRAFGMQQFLLSSVPASASWASFGN
ncbi:MAG: hypothetical protein DHS20C11_06490 [Lysobacteraceae bacterium]|nr:MAG: hypothetical protein DHS20C11_06490 [Xanthomonadaceae bacterium]